MNKNDKNDLLQFVVMVLAIVFFILVALFYPIPIEPIGDWGGTNPIH